MNMKLKTPAQGGFTLIELIVVIVILGILAATALPKFSSLGGDARVATLGAARGSLNSVVAMAHGKALLGAASPVAFEGTNVTLVNGYPKADENTAVAAGLDVVNKTDFTMVSASNTTAGNNGPAYVSNTLAIVPTSLIGNANAANCYVVYTEAKLANGVITPPTVALAPTANADTCQ